MLHLLEVMVIVGAIVFVAFMVLLALPQCRLRDMLMPFVAWGFVALCAAYTISPVDILPEVVLGPFGLFDDLGAVVAGVGTAMSIRRQKHLQSKDPHRN